MVTVRSHYCWVLKSFDKRIVMMKLNWSPVWCERRHWTVMMTRRTRRPSGILYVYLKVRYEEGEYVKRLSIEFNVRQKVWDEVKKIWVQNLGTRRNNVVLVIKHSWKLYCRLYHRSGYHLTLTVEGEIWDNLRGIWEGNNYVTRYKEWTWGAPMLQCANVQQHEKSTSLPTSRVKRSFWKHVCKYISTIN